MIPARAVLALVVCLVAACLAGCAAERADRDDCRAIFHRIVELELEKMGFSDPVLEERTKADLRERFRHEIEACVGRPIPEDAMACVASARTTEEISHGCLR
ncbi:MAG: hypothetical protein ACOC97_01855 [Myxococcota bacterium]